MTSQVYRPYKIILLLAFGMLTAKAQDSTIEVFPLRSNLHYSYDYSLVTDTYWSGTMLPEFRDSGTVDYIILSSSKSSDTTVSWRISQIRNLYHWHYFVPDTSYYIRDTTNLLLLEFTVGSHNLTANGLLWNFPLQNPLQQVSRFDSNFQTIISHSWSVGTYPGGIFGHDSLMMSDTLGPYYFNSYSLAGTYQNGTSLSLLARLRGSPVTKVQSLVSYPAHFTVNQNYPNPFNPTTTIEFETSHLSSVQVQVFDILGRPIRLLADGLFTPGIHRVLFDASSLCSGIYFYQVKSEGMLDVHKMVLLK